MAIILLDTDVFSYILYERPDAEPFRPLVRGHQICLSFITAGELLFGARKSNWGERKFHNLRSAIARVDVIQTDVLVIEQFARLVASCRQSGHPLGHSTHRSDAWIAAVAIRHNIPLVTNNRRHFKGVPGIDLIAPS